MAATPSAPIQVPIQPENSSVLATSTTTTTTTTTATAELTTFEKMRLVAAAIVGDRGVFVGPAVRESLMALQFCIEENRIIDIRTEPVVKEAIRRLSADDFFDQKGVPRVNCLTGLAPGDPRPLHITVISRALTTG